MKYEVPKQHNRGKTTVHLPPDVQHRIAHECTVVSKRHMASRLNCSVPTLDKGLRDEPVALLAAIAISTVVRGRPVSAQELTTLELARRDAANDTAKGAA